MFHKNNKTLKTPKVLYAANKSDCTLYILSAFRSMDMVCSLNLPNTVDCTLLHTLHSHDLQNMIGLATCNTHYSANTVQANTCMARCQYWTTNMVKDRNSKQTPNKYLILWSATGTYIYILHTEGTITTTVSYMLWKSSAISAVNLQCHQPWKHGSFTEFSIHHTCK